MEAIGAVFMGNAYPPASQGVLFREGALELPLFPLSACFRCSAAAGFEFSSEVTSISTVDPVAVLLWWLDPVVIVSSSVEVSCLGN